ncbi:MAG: hypothetical protein JRI80_18730, partial [Deltaproteobacteria bacterium]|nr:hypothetical protein [Deltaproteobacteria bacterium]
MMMRWRDRRRDPRTILEPPEVGLLLFASDGASRSPVDGFYVDLINRSRGGVLMKTQREIRPGALFSLQVYDARARAWVVLSADV